jgi:probable DNA repair protein
MNAMKLTDLLNSLQNCIPVVAVNRRLARRLVSEFDAQQVASGLLAWHRPPVYTYESWLKACLQEIETSDILLSPAQLQLVWEEILNDDLKSSDTSLLQVTQTAKMAVAACQLLNRYETSFNAEEGAVDHRSFLRWLETWRNLSRTNDWFDASELPGLIAGALSDGTIFAPETIIFAGFDNLTPVDQRLRLALQQQKCCTIEWQIPERSESCPTTVAATDMDDEVRQCARWARAILQSSPDAKIAVVAPQLEQYQSLFESIFFAEIDPAAMVNGDRHSTRMNVSLGQRLDRIPVVRTLLKLLSTGYQLSMGDVGWLLRSPYLSGSLTELSARALADRKLREKRVVNWTLPRLLNGLEALKVPDFSSVVHSFTKRHSTGYSCSPGAWAEIFHAEISLIGWPGERPLSSDDYQAVTSFYKTLESLATLDGVAGELNRSTAVKLLNQLCAETIFQPESQSDGVEVLGLLEAAGQSFDHLWVLGLHDAALPQPSQPNPFIPLPLQSHLEMPHADADRELSFARTVSARLFAAAPNVVLSWPDQIDGAPCRPSSLLREYASVKPAQAFTSDPASIIRDQRFVLDTVCDNRAAAIHSHKAITGGTAVVKDQAICPFRAFVHHRLRAEKLDNPDIGLDGMARGTLIHTALELFWQEVVSQKRLLSLSDDELLSLVNKVAALAISRFERQRRDDLSARQRRLETKRLVRMTLKWLDVDRERPPFTAVVEQRHTEKVGQLILRTRIDRIDTLENGHIAIVDFKSGIHVDHKQWLDQRITEPQLPIYCLHQSPDSVDAVLFGHLQGNDKNCRFVGLARDPDLWPGLKQETQEKLLEEKQMDDFDAALEHWKTVLPQLGDAFIRGEISIMPVNEESCRYCDARPICRIDMLREGGG